MKRGFEFRLERVRRVRDLEERVARSERVAAEKLARGAEATRDEARAALERSRDWLRRMLAEGGDPRRALHGERATAGELADLRRKFEIARTLRIQAERLAALHLERKNAARTLDELRERSRQRHAAALQQLEDALLDEIAQRGWLQEGERASAPGPGAAPDAGSEPAPSGTEGSPS